jgi:hypothetical protein
MRNSLRKGWPVSWWYELKLSPEGRSLVHYRDDSIWQLLPPVIWPARSIIKDSLDIEFDILFRKVQVERTAVAV